MSTVYVTATMNPIVERAALRAPISLIAHVLAVLGFRH